MGRSRLRDILIVLNPRRIDECLRSLRELDIDRLWVRNMTELEIQDAWETIMDFTAGYDRILIISDDAVVRKSALDAVKQLLRKFPVVSGYSTLDSRDWRVNLIKQPLRDLGHDLFVPEGHDFYNLDEVLCWPDPHVPTYLCGFTLTGMSREMWEQYPFGAEYGSDTNLCRRLVADGVPIVAAREAFCWHVKETWNHPDLEPRKKLLVGVEPAVVVLEAR